MVPVAAPEKSAEDLRKEELRAQIEQVLAEKKAAEAQQRAAQEQSKAAGDEDAAAKKGLHQKAWGGAKKTAGAIGTGAAGAWAATNAAGRYAIAAKSAIGKKGEGFFGGADWIILLGLVNHFVDYIHGFNTDPTTAMFDLFILVLLLIIAFRQSEGGFLQTLKNEAWLGFIFAFEIGYIWVQNTVITGGGLAQAAGVSAMQWIGFIFVKALWPAWAIVGVSKSRSKFSHICLTVLVLFWVFFFISGSTFSFVDMEQKLTPEQREQVNDGLGRLYTTYSQTKNGTISAIKCSGEAFSGLFSVSVAEAGEAGKKRTFRECMNQGGEEPEQEGANVEGTIDTNLFNMVEIYALTCGEVSGVLYYTNGQDVIIPCQLEVTNRMDKDVNIGLTTKVEQEYGEEIEGGVVLDGIPKESTNHKNIAVVKPGDNIITFNINYGDNLGEGAKTVQLYAEIDSTKTRAEKTLLVLDKDVWEQNKKAEERKEQYKKTQFASLIEKQNTIARGLYGDQITEADRRDGKIDGKLNSVSPDDLAVLNVNTRLTKKDASGQTSGEQEELITLLKSDEIITPWISVQNNGLKTTDQSIKEGYITKVNLLTITLPEGFQPDCEDNVEQVGDADNINKNAYKFSDNYILLQRIETTQPGKSNLLETPCVFRLGSGAVLPLSPRIDSIEVEMEYVYSFKKEIMIEVEEFDIEDAYMYGMETVTRSSDEEGREFTIAPDADSQTLTRGIYNTYSAYIQQAASGKSYVTPDLLVAVIAAESSGRADAISCTGCVGLMQFCADTAKGFSQYFKEVSKCTCGACQLGKCVNPVCPKGKDDRWKPRESIMAGAEYYESLMKGYQDSPDKDKFAIASYNAGNCVVKRARNDAGASALWEGVANKLDETDVEVCYKNLKFYNKYFSTPQQRQAKVNQIKAYVAYVIKYKESFSSVTSPEKPGSLKLEENTEGVVTITWAAPTGDVDVSRYEILRSNSKEGEFTALQTSITPPTMSYDDGSVEEKTTYYYKVKAISGANFESESEIAEITTKENKAPEPPAGFTAEDVQNDAGGSIILNWARSPDDGAGANDVVNYVLQRYKEGTSPEQRYTISSTGAQTYPYIDSGLQNNVQYTYKIYTLDKKGHYSSIATATATAIDNTPAT